MPSKRYRYRTKLFRELIKRLNRIHSTDEMTKEDADNILIGAITLNYKFLKSALEIEEGTKPSHGRIRKHLIARINDCLEPMA